MGTACLSPVGTACLFALAFLTGSWIGGSGAGGVTYRYCKYVWVPQYLVRSDSSAVWCCCRCCENLASFSVHTARSSRTVAAFSLPSVRDLLLREQLLLAAAKGPPRQ